MAHIKPGKLVEAKYPGESVYYTAEILTVNEEEKTVTVVFEDGEVSCC